MAVRLNVGLDRSVCAKAVDMVTLYCRHGRATRTSLDSRAADVEGRACGLYLAALPAEVRLAWPGALVLRRLSAAQP